MHSVDYNSISQRNDSSSSRFRVSSRLDLFARRQASKERKGGKRCVGSSYDEEKLHQHLWACIKSFPHKLNKDLWLSLINSSVSHVPPVSEFIGVIEFVSVTSFDNYRLCDSVRVIFSEYIIYIIYIYIIYNIYVYNIYTYMDHYGTWVNLMVIYIIENI